MNRKLSGKIGIGKVLLSLITIAIIVLASLSALALFESHRSNSEPCPTSPSTPYITEFCAINDQSSPNAITVDASGNVWFVAQAEGDLGVLYSSNSTMKLFHIPTEKPGAASWGIAIDNSRNLVWFTDYADNMIWSFNIPKGEFTSFNITASAGSSFAFPYDLVLDSKGNVWFTEAYANKIGELTNSGQLVQYPLPAQLADIPLSGAYGLAMQQNGTFWFTDPNANSIGSLSVNSPTDYAYQIYNLTGLVTQPVGIAVDSEGDVWITQHGPSLISEFNSETHLFRAITTYIPPSLGDSLPYFIYLDSKGNVWFNEHYGNAIGEFSPTNSSLIEYVIPTRVGPAGNISGAITMNLAPDGTPWFTEWFAGKIGRVNLQAPVNIGLSIQNSTVSGGLPFDLSSSSNLTLALRVSAPSSETVNLTAFLSTYNYSKPYLVESSNDLDKTSSAFVYSFSDNSGNGNFTSELSIQDQLLAPGTYYITISEIAPNIHVSQVIAIDVS